MTYLLVIPSVHLTNLSHRFSQFRCSNLPALSIFSIENNCDDYDSGGGGDKSDDTDNEYDGDDDMH
jgi:hypothetical protein